ncbi:MULTISPECIES: SLC13 family permease [unclassified Exiguobacterium]|uniref:SLC13 family permease n=1 Tax=unclassified Exiguobacterium TaxID=2644629 RepID=UPI001BEA83E1|nr:MULTISPECIES: SLC13 family permease [unclassified Exiguobacterium]
MVTVLILLGMILFFIMGWLRADLVAVIGLLCLVLTNQLTPSEAVSGFSNSVVLMIAGLFVVGAGLFHSGLAERLASLLIPYANGSETRLFYLFMLTVTFLSSIMSNTGTVALLIPVVMAMARQIKRSAKTYLMPLAFFSSIGGTMTLIGTPPNLVAAESLRGLAEVPIGFFSLLPIGLVVMVVGLVYFRLFGNRLLDQGSSNEWAKEETKEPPSPSVYVISIEKSHPLIGKRLSDLKWSHNGILVLKERIQGIRQHYETARADTVIRAGSLLVSGDEQQVRSLSHQEQIPYKKVEAKAVNDKAGGVALFTIPASSQLVGKCIGESRLRSEFHVNVLQLIRPQEEIAHVRLKDTPLKQGDLLMVQGEWDDLERIEQDTRLLLSNERVTDVANRTVSSHHQLAAGIILLMMVVLFVFEWVDPTVAVWLAALAMILSGAVRHMDVAYQSIQWSSLVLIAAMIPVGTALEHAGVMAWLVEWIESSFAGYGPGWVLVVLFIATILLSQIISNTATAILFIPLAIALAESMAVSPIPFVIAVAISASLAFMTPFGSPTNAMVFSVGGYRFVDFIKVGVPLQLLTAFFGILMILFLFPF